MPEVERTMRPRQEVQQDLVEKAKENAGVAIAVEVFEAARKHATVMVTQSPTIRYATGGNA